MDRYGKNIIYTNRPDGEEVKELYRLARNYTAQDKLNERTFKITFTNSTVTVNVYAVSKTDYKNTLIESVSLERGVAIPELTTLSSYDYVTHLDYKDTRPIDNMVFWYDGTKGTAVSEWTDQGRNGIDAKQSTAQNQPTVNDDNMQFATDDYMVIDDPAKKLIIDTDEGFNFVMDIELTSGASYATVLSTKRDGNNQGILVNLKTSHIYYEIFGEDDNSVQSQEISSSLSTNRHTIRIKFDRSELKVNTYVDGTLIDTNTITDCGKIGNHYESWIGNQYGQTSYLNAKIYKLYFEKNNN